MQLTPGSSRPPRPSATARTCGSIPRPSSARSPGRRICRPGSARPSATPPPKATSPGRAGAAKTTAARAIADGYREAGYAVHGGALAGKAADGLGQEAGIASRTLASWERAWSQGGDAPDGRSVLLIDEASMIDVRQLGRVLAHADERGAKVVLLGDPDQLPPIGGTCQQL